MMPFYNISESSVVLGVRKDRPASNPRSNKYLESNNACAAIIAMAKNAAESKEKLGKAVDRAKDADEATIAALKVGWLIGRLLVVSSTSLFIIRGFVNS